MAGYVFRTDGPWGTGKGSDLVADEIDGNFWQAIQDIQAKAVQGVGIANIIVVGNQLTFELTDHTLLGPYTLPTASFSFRGTWTPSTSYFVNDIFDFGGSVYVVLVNHVSALTFDPHATDGLGHNLYGLLLEQPSITIPAGGAIGMFLRKSGSGDYVTAWETADLEDLSDVVISTSPAPSNGDVLTYESGIWVNRTIPTATGPWDFGFSFGAEPAAGATIQTVPLTRNIVIPAHMAGTVGVCEGNPEADYEIMMTIDNILQGTITVSSVGAFTFATSGGLAVNGVAGQIVRFIAPAGSPEVTGITNCAVTVLANQT